MFVTPVSARCWASRPGLPPPAASPTTSKRSGLAAMTSSAWVPIEPVLPSISTRVLLTDLLCRAATPAELAATNELLVHKFVDAVAAELAAEAGPFDPTERQFDAVCADEVDEHHPGVQLVGHSGGLLLVSGEHIRAKAKWRVVGQFHCLLFGVSPVHDGDRTEQLLAEVRRHAGQHAGRKVRTLAVTFRHKRRPPGDRTVNLLGEPLRGGLR